MGPTVKEKSGESVLRKEEMEGCKKKNQKGEEDGGSRELS